MGKKLSSLLRKGNIITFKNQFYTSDRNAQLIYLGRETSKNGMIKLEGMYNYTIWFKNNKELINALDKRYVGEITNG